MTGGYGSVDILHNCTISVDKGEIVAIVGPNGAGKSTAMKAIFGMLKLRNGSICLDNKDITKEQVINDLINSNNFNPITNLG